MDEKRARIRSVDQLAPGLRRLDLVMVDPPAVQFRGGQFVSLRIGDGFHPRRSYSISSSPARTDGFELLARSTGGAADPFLARLAPGRELSLLGPMGFFLCDRRHPGDVVMGATGVGISALLSMAAELLELPERAQPGRILLYWGLRSEADVVLRDRLDALAARSGGRFSYELYLSEPGSAWIGNRGHITADLVATAGTCDAPTYYLCGNGAMIRDAARALIGRRVPPERIRNEVFYPAILP
jgi:ferredoxin-NADP reductase